MTNNKKKPVFDIIFSFEPKTLHDVISKFETEALLFKSLKLFINSSLLIFISAYAFEDSLNIQEQSAFCIVKL